MKKIHFILLAAALVAGGCSNAPQGQTPSTTTPATTPISKRGTTTPTPSPTAFPKPSSGPTQGQALLNPYPWHTNITATVFWVGEPVGNGSSEDNAVSAYDDQWQTNFGCFDNPEKRNGYLPAGCTPKENTFYLDLPYTDFTDAGKRKSSALSIVPWATEKTWSTDESLMKNQWVELYNPRTKQTCYGQIEDAGPYEYDDTHYVFGTKDERPKNTDANNAGMDVSPALRDCLKFAGANNDENSVNWRFIPASSVPNGPWKQTITTSQVNWQ